MRRPTATGTSIANLPSEINEHKLTHLKQLEAESIHIIREVAAEFEEEYSRYLKRTPSFLPRLGGLLTRTQGS